MNRYDQILEAIFCSWVKTLHPAYNIYANYTLLPEMVVLIVMSYI